MGRDGGGWSGGRHIHRLADHKGMAMTHLANTHTDAHTRTSAQRDLQAFVQQAHVAGDALVVFRVLHVRHSPFKTHNKNGGKKSAVLKLKFGEEKLSKLQTISVIPNATEALNTMC